MNLESKRRKEHAKLATIVVLVVGCVLLTYYFHAVADIEVVFTHFFYVPSLLAAFWWRRRGLTVPVFLAALLIASHFALRGEVPLGSDWLRAFMIVAISAVFALLSERVVALEDLRRMNRALRTLGGFSQVLLRSTDEYALLHEVCRIAVEDGGYRLAWVGIAEDYEGKKVRVVAQAGFEEGYLETLKGTWMDAERGPGLTATAIRTRRPSVARDILNDRGFAPWRGDAAKLGYASFVSLPLVSKGRVLGALNIYSPETDAFDEQEVKLLMELAHELTFSLIAFRARAHHKKVEEELRKLSRKP